MQLPIPTKKILRGSVPRIDWSHPLARGLVCCYLPGITAGKNLTGRGADMTSESAPSGRRLTSDGIGHAHLQSNSGLKTLSNVPPSLGLGATPQPPFTLFWRGMDLVPPNSNADLIGITYDNAVNGPYFTGTLYREGGTGYLVIATAAQTSLFGSAQTDGVVYDVCGTFPASGTARSYLNGIASNTITAGGTGAATAQIEMGCFENLGRYAGDVANCGYIWNRILTPAEVLALHDDPYGFLVFPEDEIFAELVGGAGAPVNITGTLAATEAQDTALINGTVTSAGITGTLDATEAPDTAVINGSVRWIATLDATEAPDTALINGAVRWVATLAATEAPDTALINGTVVNLATLAATEAPDTALINGTVKNLATLAATEAQDTALLNGTVTTAGQISGSLNVTEAQDVALLNGAVTGVAGTLDATEAPDTALINGTVRWTATLAVTEAQDTALIQGTVRWNAILAAIEAGDIALINGTVTAAGAITGTLNAIEGPDTALINGALGPVPVTGTLNATEAPDTALINARLGVFGILSAQEAQDTALINGNLVLGPLTGILAATEAPDTARINAYTELTGLPGVLTFGRTVVINRW